MSNRFFATRRPPADLSAGRRLGWAALAVLALAAPIPAWAEATEVHIAEQHGLAYLPVHVVLEQQRIEARARAAGLGKIKVTVERFGGGVPVNQAVLSGRSDVGAAGVAPLLALWDRTRGGENETRGILALAAVPLTFITNDPRVKTVRDYAGLGDHRIAVPAAAVSIQAVVLRMAAEKTFGVGQHHRLDEMVAAMPHPSAAAAIIAGRQAVRTHIATPPYSFREMTSGKGRVIATSYDFVGGPHTAVVLFATQKWKKANPKLFQAVVEAYREAIDWINADFRRAARFYLETMDSKHDLSEIESMLADKNQIAFDPTPRNTLPIAHFLHRTGAMTVKAGAWTDYFWETAHGPDGG